MFTVSGQAIILKILQNSWEKMLEGAHSLLYQQERCWSVHTPSVFSERCWSVHTLCIGRKDVGVCAPSVFSGKMLECAHTFCIGRKDVGGCIQPSVSAGKR